MNSQCACKGRGLSKHATQASRSYVQAEVGHAGGFHQPAESPAKRKRSDRVVVQLRKLKSIDGTKDGLLQLLARDAHKHLDERGVHGPHALLVGLHQMVLGEVNLQLVEAQEDFIVVKDGEGIGRHGWHAL